MEFSPFVASYLTLLPGIPKKSLGAGIAMKILFEKIRNAATQSFK
jgi:hypothetical protein